ncbi:MAG: PqiC family protein [Acetobacteraceae bacterium]
MTMRCGALAALLLLAGCAGTPATYLDLAPVPGRAAIARPAIARSAVAHIDAPIAVARVQMPAKLDRLYLTRATGADVVAVAPHTRWVAPLDGLTQHALARDLASRLPRAMVVMPGDVMPPGGVRLVRVNVLRFMPVLGGAGGSRMVLDADWAVMARHGGGARESGRLRLTIPAGRSDAAQAAAMSAALGELADRIAARLAQG